MRKQRDRKQGCCKSIQSFFKNIGRTPNPVIHEKYIDAAPINAVVRMLPISFRKNYFYLIWMEH